MHLMKIGLRMPGTSRQMPFADFCKWCRENGFDGVDVGPITPEIKRTMDAAGLEIGTSDLPGLSGLFGSDEDVEKAVAVSTAAMDAAAAHGVTRLFTVLLPPDPSRGRSASFARLKETFGPVVRHAEEKGVRISVEGWPGGGPHYGALAVTPETVRALLEAFPSPALGLNYDPSHLIRIGVDYLRFLREFGPKVVHCHGKDTIFDGEALYLHGNLGPTFGQAKAFGEDWWRYTIPGEGLADWGKICAELDAVGYDGFISVELEDFRYHRTWEAESEGLLRAKRHLANYV
jgi:sugar phosphate isomerase/epimerase